MGRTTTLPPQLTGRPFLVRDALALGVPPGALRGPGLRAPFRGVRVPVGLGDGLDVDCRALALLLPRAAATSVTALRLAGLPVDGPERPIHVSVPLAQGPVRVRGVVAHRDLVPDRVRRSRSGLRVVDPAWAWAASGSLLRLDDLVVVADALVRRGTADLDRLREVTSAAGPARGVRRLRAALALARDGADSPPETRLRLAVVRSGLPEPALQHTVRDRWGAVLGRTDLAWPERRVAVEYDGAHHRELDQWRYDVQRKRALEEAGWRVYVATAVDQRAGFRDCLRWLARELAA